MLKAKEIFDTMIENYCASCNCPVVVENVGLQESESYRIQYVGGRVTLSADNPFGAVLGWRRARYASETGFIREHLGRHRPRFSLRMFQGAPHEIEEAVKQGYNAVLCAPDDDTAPYREAGLKVFLSLSNPEEPYRAADGIFVESELTREDEMKTRIEMLEDDLARWEAHAEGGTPLIYHLVHGTGEAWTRWFWELCLKAKKGTTLAFSASCPESFWVRLRQSLDLIPNPMLIVADCDADLSDRLRGHAFCGGLSKNAHAQFFLN